jgi:hypothetical protein
MTTHAEATDELLDLFTTGWADRTEVAYPNVDFTPPEDAAWVRVTIQHTAGRQVSLGSPGARTFRRFGTIFAQIFTVEGTAAQEALDLAGVAVTILEGVQFASGLQLQAATIDEVGPDGHGRWQVNVSVPFYFNLEGA